MKTHALAAAVVACQAGSALTALLERGSLAVRSDTLQDVAARALMKRQEEDAAAEAEASEKRQVGASGGAEVGKLLGTRQVDAKAGVQTGDLGRRQDEEADDAGPQKRQDDDGTEEADASAERFVERQEDESAQAPEKRQEDGEFERRQDDDAGADAGDE